MFEKSFIYLTIIVIIATLNNVDLALAKDNKLANMAVSRQNPSGFESPVARMRRGIGSRQVAEESDVPKDQLYVGSHLMFRRQTSAGEPDVPKELQKDSQRNRAKRQMPSPPGDIPIPPM